MNADFKKVKKVPVPIYPFEITFSILSKEGEKVLDDKDRAAMTKRGQNGQIYIYLKPNASLPIVVHELFHATELIMESIGQKTSDCPNETWAYLIQWITREYEKFNK